MLAVLNLQTARDKCLPPIKDPNKAEFKVGDMVLLKNHTPTTAFDSRYKTSFRIGQRDSVKVFNVQDCTGKIRWVSIQQFQLLLTYLI